MAIHIGRRYCITLLGGAAALPFVARAQQSTMPVIVFLHSETLTDMPQDRVTAFRQGLREAGFIEGQNVAIEYRSAESQMDRLPLLVADLLRRQVALIVGNTCRFRMAPDGTLCLRGPDCGFGRWAATHRPRCQKRP
jgi:putative tryptophan/tyrosine transport system substrate-binding protein